MILSQVIVAGFNIKYIDIRGSFNNNVIKYNKEQILIGLFFLIVLYPIINYIFYLVDSYIFEKKNLFLEKNHFSVFSFIIIYSSWIPYIMTYYPGGIVGDGLEIINRAMSEGVPLNAHWSIVYIYILKIFIKIGLLLGDINKGIFLYTILESIVYALSCTRICYEIYKRVGNYSYLCVIMYAFSGFFASYSIVYWTDSLFSCALVLIGIYMYNIYRYDKKIVIGDCIKIFLLALFISLWRNNGIYILVVCIIGLLYVNKKEYSLIKTIVLAIVISFIIKGPIYTSFGIDTSKDSKVESLSIPIQQVAAVINAGYELDNDDEKILYSIIPKEKWISLYAPTLSDDLKNSVDKEYLDSHSKEFMCIWGKLLVNNSAIYVRAYLLQTIGFWKIGMYQGNYWDYWLGVVDNDIGIKQTNLLKKKFGIDITKELEKRMDFVSSGTMVWLMFFSICAILYQKRNKNRIVFFLPLVGCWITVMIACPIAFAYRYILAIAMSLPVIILLPFEKE